MKSRHALFDKTDISHLGCYYYISEHATYVGSFRTNVFINYRNLIIIVNAVFEKNTIVSGDTYLPIPISDGETKITNKNRIRLTVQSLTRHTAYRKYSENHFFIFMDAQNA
jgi:hypothetical protein